MVAPTGYGKSTYENGPTEEGRCRSCAEASNDFGQTLSDGPTLQVGELVLIGPHWSPLVPIGPHLPEVGPSGCLKHKKHILVN